MNNKHILVVMAGGKSSRMQVDKALLPFSGYNSLAQYQCEKHKNIFSKIYISSKDNKFDFELNLIKDCHEISSPLVALISIFETLDVREVFVLSVDSPLISSKIIEKIYNNALEDSTIIVAETDDGVEPLCAIYRREVLESAKKLLAENNHRLKTLFEMVETQKVFFDDSKYFVNLNYPKDYERVFKSSLII